MGVAFLRGLNLPTYAITGNHTDTHTLLGAFGVQTVPADRNTTIRPFIKIILHEQLAKPDIEASGMAPETLTDTLARIIQFTYLRRADLDINMPI